MKVILASNNAGKIRELSALLKTMQIEIIPQAEMNIPDIEETGLTFIENALLKARHASQIARLPAIADDSGLAVAALNGEPGIYSARYAGKQGDANANINKLLEKMNHVPDDKREAHFHCVLVFLRHANDPTPLVCDGIWHGHILREAHGSAGFGYDPVFYVPSENKSAAELLPETKNKISHRALAMQKLLQGLRQR